MVAGKWAQSGDWHGWQGWAGGFQGRLYGDGSCDACPIGELRRAACALVQVDEGGQAKRRITAVIPSSMPQTPQAAEDVAAALAVRFATGDFTYIGDCKGVVTDLTRPVASMLASSRKHAGVLLDTLANPGQRQRMQDVEWMASHRALQAEADDKQRRDHFGNELADTAAKEARSRHPQTESEGVEEASYYMKRAKWVAQAIAIAMAMFPPRGERLRRTQNGNPSASDVEERRRAWLFTDGAWRCGRCGTWKSGGE